ncbi:nicotinic acid mononucleotide adenylyltransferase [Pseudomonas fluorescens]|uniref:nicotinic acid mononucleotide adenylyltransferase n=1 Tax=Pseudomonas fluorescens TaxID=294 RepID=UPI001930CD7B|nr:nicotinic acid mononucleotide adenylyltransferase [Pseudomonas fluorescens]MBD8088645.1 nicotinic acid mononucleotide adenylyltransferase [Pseudomonas fluorescens]
MKIALFGSAFNPPSLGHADCIEQLSAYVDAVWLIPSYKHAFSKNMTDYGLRCEWVEAFAKDLPYPVEMMAVEHEIAQLTGSDRPVYSYEVVEHLCNAFPEHQYLLAIGPDNMQAWSRFSHIEQIHNRCQIFVTQERKQVRSTGIRKELALGYVPPNMLTPNVQNLLKSHNPWEPRYVA